jgi:1,4-dihydroxy-2-naphthoate octaprenyltransferase
MKREGLGGLVANWNEIIQTQNLSDDQHMDLVSRWLLIIRASVFPMTIISALIGGLLAFGRPGADWWYFTLALVGLVIAHAANNMINDYFDLGGGVDTEGYVRTVYAPHPILSGLVSKEGLIAAIAICNFIDLWILYMLATARGPGVVAFALSGLFISIFYVAPPLKLKHRGMGEPGVFIVWGPLMIGGTYFVTTGFAPGWVFIASLPYALLVSAVLFGKHIDKLPADAAKGINTLPVILGESKARVVAQGLMIAFYAAVIASVFAGVLSLWCLIVLLSVPRLLETLETYRSPRPDGPPEGFPIWPLWYVAWAFRLTRSAGGLLVLGLVIHALIPLSM